MPDAPDGVRGEFRPAATRVAGLKISDPTAHLSDPLGRPLGVSSGSVVSSLLG